MTTWLRALALTCAFTAGMVAHAFLWVPFVIEADGVTLKCVETGAIIAGNVLAFIGGITFGSAPLYPIINKLRRENASLRGQT